VVHDERTRIGGTHATVQIVTGCHRFPLVTAGAG
jgi:hypothetical protein